MESVLEVARAAEDFYYRALTFEGFRDREHLEAVEWKARMLENSLQYDAALAVHQECLQFARKAVAHHGWAFHLLGGSRIGFLRELRRVPPEQRVER